MKMYFTASSNQKIRKTQISLFLSYVFRRDKMANSMNPDQTISLEQSDLGLNYLLRSVSTDAYGICGIISWSFFRL